MSVIRSRKLHFAMVSNISHTKVEAFDKISSCLDQATIRGMGFLFR